MGFAEEQGVLEEEGLAVFSLQLKMTDNSRVQNVPIAPSFLEVIVFEFGFSAFTKHSKK